IFAFALRGAPPELSGPLILRLYRRETDASRAAAEAAIHRTVAALGYPCPPALLVGEASDGLAGGGPGAARGGGGGPAGGAALPGRLAGLGYLCPPAVVVGEGSDGRAGGFLVLPRVPGHVLLDESWGPGVVRMPGILARLHVALHALDP